MQLKGHTPLDSMKGLSDETRQALAKLWITSVEELVAVSAAVSGSAGEAASSLLGSCGLSEAVAAAEAALSPGRLAGLTQPKAGGALGCRLDPEVLRAVETHGRVRSRVAQPEGAFEGKLPPAVRLMDNMPPVRDQGQRGTCVAFATVALREFLNDCREDLSEQFLYWACKQLDGLPEPGTYIHTAMSALAEYGVCTESIWPYNPVQTDDEAQGPPPPGGIEAAKRYILPVTRTVEPNLIVHYKRVLAGEAGRPCRRPPRKSAGRFHASCHPPARRYTSGPDCFPPAPPTPAPPRRAMEANGPPAKLSITRAAPP